MATRHVRHGSKERRGQRGAGAYVSAAQPAPDLASAIAAADPGDTVLVLDTAVYVEGPIVIDKPLTLQSSAWAGAPKPRDKAFKPEHYPHLAAPRGQRVLLVLPPKGDTLKPGPVRIRGFVIERGSPAFQASDAALQGGAGIAVVGQPDTGIEDCLIQDNRLPAQDRGTYTLDPLRRAIENVVRRWLSDAMTLVPDVVGPTAVQAQALLIAELDEELKARFPPSRPNHILVAQGSGGGILYYWSEGHVKGCVVRRNAAFMRGGGVAVVGYGWPLIDDCTIEDNTAQLKDGAGIALEVSIPGKIGEDLTEKSLLQRVLPFFNDNVAMLKVLLRLMAGGGRQLAMSLVQAGIELARASRLARPDRAQIDKWKAILKLRKKEFISLLLYEAVASFLKQEWKKHWNEQGLADARRKQVVIRNTQLLRNSAADDGGGFYASVMSRALIEGGTVRDNIARGGKGGGLRLSMGSQLTARGLLVERNRCPFADPEDKTRFVGGGLSSRNCGVTLESLGSAATRIKDNRTDHLAGGGVSIEAISEGDIGPLSDAWHAILLEVFGVTDAPVRLNRGTTISGNHAGSQRGQPRAKAGGLYVLRAAFQHNFPLDVEVEAYKDAVVDNRSALGEFVNSQHRKIRTHQANLVDLGLNPLALNLIRRSVDDGDDEVAARVSFLSGTFKYRS